MARRRAGWDGSGLVGFEDFEAAKLLVEHGEGLKSLGFENLLVEPRLDLILLEFGEFLVGVVEVASERTH